MFSRFVVADFDGEVATSVLSSFDLDCRPVISVICINPSRESRPMGFNLCTLAFVVELDLPACDFGALCFV
jgi:hypothetical protein